VVVEKTQCVSALQNAARSRNMKVSNSYVKSDTVKMFGLESNKSKLNRRHRPRFRSSGLFASHDTVYRVQQISSPISLVPENLD
jgi:hypothetical protein